MQLSAAEKPEITKHTLEALNTFLANTSYITGFQPSNIDINVFTLLQSSMKDNNTDLSQDTIHLHRWYNHMSSYDVHEVTTCSHDTTSLQKILPICCSLAGKSKVKN